jgi:peptidoglycan/xylan/chitin deacetylase (PgdA/CDA1 family)
VLAHLLAPHVPRAAQALGIQRTVSGGVALTFDDGPHAEGTPAVLEILAAADIKATFFLVGEQVVRRPALAAQVAAAGHVIALHGHRHRPQPALPARVVEDDLARGAAAISDATGIQPVWHRPPYGLYSPGGLDAVRRHAMKPLLWSKWGKDWRRLTPPGPQAAPVVALGQGLAQVHDPGQDRAPRHAPVAARRRDPPARCGFLQLERLSSAHREGPRTDRERTQTSENRYRPTSLTGWIVSAWPA